jgi:hypothetical protein
LKTSNNVERRSNDKVYNFEVANNHNYFVGEQGVLVHNAGCASKNLPRLKGKGTNEIENTLQNNGFTKTNQSAVGNQTWNHPDGSKVRIDPYGNQSTSQYKTANNGHVHKYDNMGNQLNDRGVISTNPGETHIGIPNPPNLPTVRGRPHGSGNQ